MARLTKFETAEHSPYIDDLFALAKAFRLRAHTLARRMCDTPSHATKRKASGEAARS